MRFSLLGSGSKGNCLYVENDETAVLIDAGFTGKEITRRLALIGRDPARLTAIFITHEHNDHIAGAGVLSRRLSIPVYANRGTALGGESHMGALFSWQEFSGGDRIELDGLELHSFALSHDTSDPVGFVVGDGICRLACCTDTGYATNLIRARLSGCQALALEFNHDPQMLKDGPYPLELQQRIRSRLGHLANIQAGELLRELVHDDLRHVVLAHLSETNNKPELALQAARAVLGDDWPGGLLVARQDQPTPLIELDHCRAP
ncbi:MAG: MBL fold metallo-hydrolase [Desulfobulbaceae bacterium]|jgi:phosphoribosyl 1,2-cyclic phosphodiesterase|nr:MBL fold metallo-hydrolase [Desulfobulbaceae bacterium]